MLFVQVDPEYEGRIKQIKKRWLRLSNQAHSLNARQKQFYLGKENWEPKTIAKVSLLTAAPNFAIMRYQHNFLYFIMASVLSHMSFPQPFVTTYSF